MLESSFNEGNDILDVSKYKDYKVINDERDNLSALYYMTPTSTCALDSNIRSFERRLST